MEEFLKKDNKRMPYTVPEGFFEEMHERLMETSSHLYLQPSVQQGSVTHHRSFKRFWMPAAAVVLLVAGVSFYALHRMGQSEPSLLADQTEAVETYMSDDALDEWIAIYENKNNMFL